MKTTSKTKPESKLLTVRTGVRAGTSKGGDQQVYYQVKLVDILISN